MIFLRRATTLLMSMPALGIVTASCLIPSVASMNSTDDFMTLEFANDGSASTSADHTTLTPYTTDQDWLFSCALSGASDGNTALDLPTTGSLQASVLRCIVDSSLTARFTEEELNRRGPELNWCFPPSFLSRSCDGGFTSSGAGNDDTFDPYDYLFGCLDADDAAFPPMNEITFYFSIEQWVEAMDSKDDGNGNELMTLEDPYMNNSIVIIEPLMETTCSLLDGIRSIEGILCLVDVCQMTMPPSQSPSFQPSLAPTEVASQVPSDVPSFVPSFQPSTSPSQIPSLVASSSPSSSLVPSASPTDDLRFPNLVLQVEILMRLILNNVTAPPSDEDTTPIKYWVEAIGSGVHNYIIEKRLPGHMSVNVVAVDGSTDNLQGRRVEESNIDFGNDNDGVGDTNVSVVVRVVARRECQDDDDECSAATVSNDFIASYRDTLQEGSTTGDLAMRIVYFAQILQVEELYNVSVDPNSVGSLTSSRTIEVDVPKSSAVLSVQSNEITFVSFAILAATLVMH